jgi:hypothetical protein
MIRLNKTDYSRKQAERDKLRESLQEFYNWLNSKVANKVGFLALDAIEQGIKDIPFKAIIALILVQKGIAWIQTTLPTYTQFSPEEIDRINEILLQIQNYFEIGKPASPEKERLIKKRD